MQRLPIPEQINNRNARALERHTRKRLAQAAAELTPPEEIQAHCEEHEQRFN